MASQKFLDLQRDEVVALQSIFGDDFEVVKDAWKTPNSPDFPTHFKLKVMPHPTSAQQVNHVSVYLDILLMPQYPQRAPTLRVEKVKGLSNQDLAELSKLVQEEARRLQGSEMIYALCQFVQEYLIEHNYEQVSFHDQMVEREKQEAIQLRKLEMQERKKTNHEKKIARDDYAKKIAAEQKKKELMWKEQCRRLGTEDSTGMGILSEDEDEDGARDPEEGEEWTHDINRHHRDNLYLSLADEPDEEDNEDDSEDEEPSELLPFSRRGQLIHPHTSPLRKPMAFPSTKGELTVPFREDSKFSSKTLPKTFKMSEGISLSSLSQSMSQAKATTPSNHSTLSHTLSRAIASANANPISSANPTTNTIHTSSAARPSNVKTSVPIAITGSANNKAQTQNSKATHNKLPTKSPVFPPKNFLPNDDDFSLDSDIDKQLSATGFVMGERDKDELGAIGSPPARLGKTPISDDDDQDVLFLSASPPLRSQRPSLNMGIDMGGIGIHEAPFPSVSRFHTDFEELGRLGQGGFGEVLKARNKLDGLVYAIKRIKLKRKHPALNKKIVREVSTIAMLHHRYIVRYFQAWIEGGDSALKNTSVMDEALQDDEDWMDPSRSTMGGNDDDGDDDEDEDEDDEEDEDDDEDDDEEDDEGDESDMSDEELGYHPKKTNSNTQYLYIQMEYCPNKTLRDVIDEKGCENPEQIWRLFRQTLEGMRYVHQQGIIHRDIKPANIFIDSEGNIKLGDFGLAVLSGRTMNYSEQEVGANSAITSPPSSTSSVASRDEFVKKTGATKNNRDTTTMSVHSTITEVVGTPFYRSPEQEAEGVEYDHKADMYALGIIFFEMWRPFGTLMERASCLEALRKTGLVPTDFLAGRPERESVRKIIEWLLKQDSRERPNASDLLKSGLIPLKIEDEYIEDALASVTAKDSALHTRLMEGIFSAPSDDMIDFTYDYMSSNRLYSTVHQQWKILLQAQVHERITHIFRLHGAAHIETPLLMPKSNKLADKKNAAYFVDPMGTLVQLPYTLTIPFARFCAQQSTSSMGMGRESGWRALPGTKSSSDANGVLLDLRRYDIAKVFRKSIAGGRPKELYECDFDIVWPDCSSNFLGSKTKSNNTAKNKKVKDAKTRAKEKAAALTAEALKALDQVLSDFSFCVGNYSLRLNHLDLLDSIIDHVLAISRSLYASAAASSGGMLPAISPSASGSHSIPTVNASSASNHLTSAVPLSPSLSGAPGLPGTVPSLSLAVPAASHGASSVSPTAMPLSPNPRVSPSLSPVAAPSASPTIVDLAKADAELRRQIRHLASQRQVLSHSWSKSAMRRQLLHEKKLHPRAVEVLGSCLELRSAPGQPELVFRKLKQILPVRPNSASEARLLDAVESVRLLFVFLAPFGLADKVVLDLGLVGNYDLYAGGLVFQAVVDNKHSHHDSSHSHATPHHSNAAQSHSSASAAGKPPLHSSRAATNKAEHKMEDGPLDVIAVGGRYDQLLARFTSPNINSVPLSGVGVNLAIEKIVAGAINEEAVAKRTGRASRLANKRLFCSLSSSHDSSSAAHSSSSLISPLTSRVLLFCAAGHLLKERAAFATQLWNEGLHAEYMHPNDLSVGMLRHYCKEMAFKYVVVFRRGVFRTNHLVQVHDMSFVSRSSVKLSGKSAQERDNSADVWQIPVSQLISFLKSRSSRESNAETSSGSSTSSSSKSSGSGGNDYAMDVDIIDPHKSVRSYDKSKIAVMAKRVVGPLVSALPVSSFCVVAVDLPLTVIRSLLSSFYRGADSTKEVVDAHNKQRTLLEALLVQLKRRTSNPNAVKFFFAYSVPDRKSDVFVNT